MIVPSEIRELEAYGVAKIYSPEDGAALGLQGIINHMMAQIDFSTIDEYDFSLNTLEPGNKTILAKLITAMELAKTGGNGHLNKLKSQIQQKMSTAQTPVIGITGTGGAGKSSLTDELISRLLRDIKEIRIGILSCDPSRRKTGGALLGDRVRMNAIYDSRVYMRSLATRDSSSEIPLALTECVDVLKAAAFDLIIIETASDRATP